MTDNQLLKLVVALALYPLEFYVSETPKSQQAESQSKKRWKKVVEKAAKDRVRVTDELGLLFPCPVALTIYYFPIAEMVGDIDNIVKPIMDALINVAYPDDKLVERVVVQRFEPNIKWEFANPSEQLADAFTAAITKAPVVYVRVEDDLGWRKN